MKIIKRFRLFLEQSGKLRRPQQHSVVEQRGVRAGTCALAMSEPAVLEPTRTPLAYHLVRICHFDFFANVLSWYCYILKYLRQIMLYNFLIYNIIFQALILFHTYLM